MEAYLDNGATTKTLESVKDVIVKVLCEDYGNPSSMHQKGVDAEKYIIEAKNIIADSLKADPKEIVFTSGGTESNNMALIGAAMAYKRSGNHIITTRIEHPSIHNPLSFLEETGFRISYLPVDKYGKVEIDALLNEICEETILVSIMYVNNEIGSVQDIAQIAKLIKGKNPKVIFHVDGIQAYGKYRIFPKKMGIDLLSISGHKIHGPKGIGALYIRDKVKMKPILFGGGQQKGMRSGTENVPGIAGLGVAVKEIYMDHELKIKKLYGLKKIFIQGVKEIEDIIINGITDNEELTDTAPHIISVSFGGIRSEVLLHTLEENNIYVSAGSACASNHPQLSGTLKAIGIKKELLDSTIRFSFSINTTLEEIEYTLSTLKEVIPVLRRYSRH
ncbi:cysteine desulfurase [Mobilisporobacter senegalensis]|uniref:Cysteine desulfurase n=1 Tax=Mobilisporobacter senegalensis TaxID=1329262 RepID=A0A3N1Y068_9FIRM|nr:cysteine desulfurase family protein [Mobilisporobacter senegalensis]ROR30617.1 cysteine desulfurase [Mobilisporobacter senegalensis]